MARSAVSVQGLVGYDATNKVAFLAFRQAAPARRHGCRPGTRRALQRLIRARAP